MWPYMGGVAWKYMENSGVVVEGDAIIFGVSMDGDTSGAQAILYEGLETTSGKKMLHIDTLANRSQVVNLTPGLRVDRGCYVTIDANVENITVWFKRLKDI